jgi:hypothetical protein
VQNLVWDNDLGPLLHQSCQIFPSATDQNGNGAL